MDKIAAFSKYDALLNIASGGAFLTILAYFYGNLLPWQSIHPYLREIAGDPKVLTPIIFLILSYIIGFLITVLYLILISRVMEFVIPDRVRSVFFAEGLAPGFQKIIGEKISDDERKLIIQKAKKVFPEFPATEQNLTDEHCKNLFRLTEYKAQHNENAARNLEKIENAGTLAGRIGVSVWIALSIVVIMKMFYVILIVFSPFLYALIMYMLRILPIEFNEFFNELLQYLISLKVDSVSVARLTFHVTFILLLNGVVTVLLLIIYQFYKLKYDREMFRHFAFSIEEKN